MPRRCFVCRCEDVTVHELEHALSLGFRRVEELKRYTGLGTGPCQGKECLASLARWMQAQGLDAELPLAPFTPRPPLEAVSFAALAAREDDPSEGDPKASDGAPE